MMLQFLIISLQKGPVNAQYGFQVVDAQTGQALANAMLNITDKNKHIIIYTTYEGIAYYEALKYEFRQTINVTTTAEHYKNGVNLNVVSGMTRVKMMPLSPKPLVISVRFVDELEDRNANISLNVTKAGAFIGHWSNAADGIIHFQDWQLKVGDKITIATARNTFYANILSELTLQQSNTMKLTRRTDLKIDVVVHECEFAPSYHCVSVPNVSVNCSLPKPLQLITNQNGMAYFPVRDETWMWDGSSYSCTAQFGQYRPMTATKVWYGQGLMDFSFRKQQK